MGKQFVVPPQTRIALDHYNKNIPKRLKDFIAILNANDDLPAYNEFIRSAHDYVGSLSAIANRPVLDLDDSDVKRVLNPKELNENGAAVLQDLSNNENLVTRDRLKAELHLLTSANELADNLNTLIKEKERTGSMSL